MKTDLPVLMRNEPTCIATCELSKNNSDEDITQKTKVDAIDCPFWGFCTVFRAINFPLFEEPAFVDALSS